MATSELTYTLVLLGSESSQVAEHTYINRFKRQVNTLDAAVRLAISRHQEPNVRFYASCLVADKKGSVNENDFAEEPPLFEDE